MLLWIGMWSIMGFGFRVEAGGREEVVEGLETRKVEKLRG